MRISVSILCVFSLSGCDARIIGATDAAADTSSDNPVEDSLVFGATDAAEDANDDGDALDSDVMDAPSDANQPTVDWPAFGGIAPNTSPQLEEMTVPDYLVFKPDPRTESFADGRVLTETARVTDAAAFSVNSNHMQHNYAKVSPWNADNSYAMVFAFGSGTEAILIDGQSYEFIRKLPNTYVGGRWSLTDPKIYFQIAFGDDPSLYATNVDDGSRTKVKDFRDEGYVEQARVGMFGGEGNQSVDDSIWAFQLRHPERGWEIVVWNKQLDQVVGRIEVSEPAGPGSDQLDYMAISPLGNYVIIYGQRSWQHRGETIPAGLNVFDATGSYVHTVDANGHVDYCLDMNGNEVVAFLGSKYEANDKVLQTARLDGSQAGDSSDQMPDGYIGWNYHISCASTSKPGYVIVSDYPSQTPESYSSFPMWNHAFAVKLDGSGEVALISGVHHKNDYEPEPYPRSSFGVANRDLSAIWFSSEWDGTDSAIHSFVARPKL